MANLVLMFQQLRFAIKEFFNLKLNLRNKNKEVFMQNQGIVFCTSYMDKDPDRYSQWAKYYQKCFLPYGIDLLMVDDGSKEFKIPNVEIINLQPHLGRESTFVMTGWKRSFFHGLNYAVEKNYKYISHIESDLWIRPERIKKFIEFFKKENVFLTGNCRTFHIPETAIMVMNNKNANNLLLSKYKNPISWKESSFFERYINEIRDGHFFSGDRYEDVIKRIKKTDDYIAQIKISEASVLFNSL